MYARGVGFLVVKGGGCTFGFDDWAGVSPLHVLYPRVFRVVYNKESSVSDCFVWRGIEKS